MRPGAPLVDAPMPPQPIANPMPNEPTKPALAPALERDCANAIRALAMDAVQAANSGHPGMPMGMAEIAVALWQRHLRHNPANPAWLDRDRFVLSNGHGSMLLYALLHLTGYALPMDELKRFRKLRSKTPGHPEVGHTPGVETTTGPLGQGLANAVGMAIAEKLLAAEFNRPEATVVDHFTYAFAGDGCLMEGISHEACSLAGTLGLGKLIVFYDDNGISIDGKTEGWFTDDTWKRFDAYGWHVIPKVDGHDVAAVDRAIAFAKAATDRPSLVMCKTIIGKGSPNRQGSAKTHGEALGIDEVAATRANIGWPHPPFEIPQPVRDAWSALAAGRAHEMAWNERFARYAGAHPGLAAEFKRRTAGELPAEWADLAHALADNANVKAESISTRKASQACLEQLGPDLPELLGGSADLAGSVFTAWKGSRPMQADEPGNFINYGVREFAMAAITNGVALHGGFIPYTGTFLTFSDYSRNALRMAALMKLRNIFVFTHDSIGLGEDGPTHQPIEHVASLRLIPNMELWRPCDTVETAYAWAAAITRRDGPTSLVFTRQNVAFESRAPEVMANIARGGYVLSEGRGRSKAVLIATGSELEIAIKAQALLAKEGVHVRVVSMPCTSRFDQQDASYKASVLLVHGESVPRVAVEAGVGDYWYKYVGLQGAVVGIDRFGESAPAKELFTHFGFTAENVAKTVRSVI